MSAPKCKSWRGHKFAPRYSTRPQNLLPKDAEQMFWLNWEDRRRLTMPIQTYECDVCTRCGLVVQKAGKC